MWRERRVGERDETKTSVVIVILLERETLSLCKQLPAFKKRGDPRYATNWSFSYAWLSFSAKPSLT